VKSVTSRAGKATTQEGSEQTNSEQRDSDNEGDARGKGPLQDICVSLLHSMPAAAAMDALKKAAAENKSSSAGNAPTQKDSDYEGETEGEGPHKRLCESVLTSIPDSELTMGPADFYKARIRGAVDHMQKGVFELYLALGTKRTRNICMHIPPRDLLRKYCRGTIHPEKSMEDLDEDEPGKHIYDFIEELANLMDDYDVDSVAVDDGAEVASSGNEKASSDDEDTTSEEGPTSQKYLTPRRKKQKSSRDSENDKKEEEKEMKDTNLRAELQVEREHSEHSENEDNEEEEEEEDTGQNKMKAKQTRKRDKDKSKTARPKEGDGVPGKRPNSLKATKKKPQTPAANGAASARGSSGGRKNANK
jgi:hypothetical protein